MPVPTKSTFDAFDAIAQFQLQVLNNKPSPTQMKRDIQMNQLNIRPFVGDVFSLNMSNQNFIDALWSLVKLDEYAISIFGKLPKNELTVFSQLVGNYRQQFQDVLNRLDLRLPHARLKGHEQTVAIEIYRDLSRSRRRVH